MDMYIILAIDSCIIPCAAAYFSSEGSVMERHHFSQTMCILNTEGCNIFENISREDYEQTLDLVRDVILSTDIAHHLRIRGGLEAMVEGEIRPRFDLLTEIIAIWLTSQWLEHTMG